MQGSNHGSSRWNRGRSPSHARHGAPGARGGIAAGDGKAAGDAGNELPRSHGAPSLPRGRAAAGGSQPPGRDVPRSAAPQIRGTTATHVSMSSALLQGQAMDPERSLLPRAGPHTLHTSSPGQPEALARATKPLTAPYQPFGLLSFSLRPSLEQSPNRSLMLAPFVAFNNPRSLVGIHCTSVALPRQRGAPVAATSIPVWLHRGDQLSTTDTGGNPPQEGGVSPATCQGAPGARAMHRAPWKALLPPQSLWWARGDDCHHLLVTGGDLSAAHPGKKRCFLKGIGCSSS